MTQFLVVYNRVTQAATITEFDRKDRAGILQARLAAESVAGPSTEVAILAASSRAELARTHARYFKPRSEIAEELGKLLAS